MEPEQNTIFFQKSGSDVPLLETNDKRTKMSTHVHTVHRALTG